MGNRPSNLKEIDLPPFTSSFQDTLFLQTIKIISFVGTVSLIL